MIQLTTLAALLLIPFAALAIDHKNLDDGRPWQMEDPYPIAQGEWVFEGGTGFRSVREGADHAILPLQILYGVLPNFHFELGTDFFSSPRSIEGSPKSGDAVISGLYNFNQETLGIPALGLKLGVKLPTGVESSGVGGEIKGLVSQSIGRLNLHLNGNYEFESDPKPGDRDSRYRVVLGAAYPIGAPMNTRTLLGVDLFTAQALSSDESNTFGTELGMRYQLSTRVVLDACVGSEFSGPENRTPFFASAGISAAY